MTQLERKQKKEARTVQQLVEHYKLQRAMRPRPIAVVVRKVVQGQLPWP